MSRLVAVTGAAGWLGSECAAALRAAGARVRRLTRVPQDREDVAFRLGEPVDPAALSGVDALIHAAHDFSVRGWPEMRRVNVEGSEALLRAAEAAGVRRVVFVSSISAYEGCLSLYGRAKLEIEVSTAARGGISVRPGLLYDRSGRGMFGALTRLSRRTFLPLIDGGRQPLYLAHVGDVRAAIVSALDWDAAAQKVPVTLAHPEPVTLEKILREQARAQGRSFIAVPVPGGLALAGLRALEAAGLRPRTGSDSLIALQNPNPRPDFSAQTRLGLSFRRFLDQSPTA
ncbi:MAG: NAD-dependent epimerase/dehydratase family protein [Elusimicrobia bacterium]|nr:NAD-dependent epimerase/dehydratase family protein [Elusimicrobiota bacterium]